MKNAFTYKQKFFGVLFIFIVVLMAAYKKTFRQAFIAKKELGKVEQKLLNLKNLNNELINLEQDIKVLDTFIGGQATKPELIQQEILSFITNSGFELNVVSIEDTHLFSNKEFLIYTNQIELEGAFKSLVKIQYEIEKNFRVSRVISSKLYSKKNYKTNKTKLYLKMILQNYEKNK